MSKKYFHKYVVDKRDASTAFAPDDMIPNLSPYIETVLVGDVESVKDEESAKDEASVKDEESTEYEEFVEEIKMNSIFELDYNGYITDYEGGNVNLSDIPGMELIMNFFNEQLKKLKCEGDENMFYKLNLLNKHICANLVKRNKLSDLRNYIVNVIEFNKIIYCENRINPRFNIFKKIERNDILEESVFQISILNEIPLLSIEIYYKVKESIYKIQNKKNDNKNLRTNIVMKCINFFNSALEKIKNEHVETDVFNQNLCFTLQYQNAFLYFKSICSSRDYRDYSKQYFNLDRYFSSDKSETYDEEDYDDEYENYYDNQTYDYKKIKYSYTNIIGMIGLLYYVLEKSKMFFNLKTDLNKRVNYQFFNQLVENGYYEFFADRLGLYYTDTDTSDQDEYFRNKLISIKRLINQEEYARISPIQMCELIFKKGLKYTLYITYFEPGLNLNDDNGYLWLNLDSIFYTITYYKNLLSQFLKEYNTLTFQKIYIDESVYYDFIDSIPFNFNTKKYTTDNEQNEYEVDSVNLKEYYLNIRTELINDVLTNNLVKLGRLIKHANTPPFEKDFARYILSNLFQKYSNDILFYDMLRVNINKKSSLNYYISVLLYSYKSNSLKNNCVLFTSSDGNIPCINYMSKYIFNYLFKQVKKKTLESKVANTLDKLNILINGNVYNEKCFLIIFKEYCLVVKDEENYFYNRLVDKKGRDLDYKFLFDEDFSMETNKYCDLKIQDLMKMFSEDDEFDKKWMFKYDEILRKRGKVSEHFKRFLFVKKQNKREIRNCCYTFLKNDSRENIFNDYVYSKLFSNKSGLLNDLSSNERELSVLLNRIKWSINNKFLFCLQPDSVYLKYVIFNIKKSNRVLVIIHDIVLQSKIVITFFEKPIGLTDKFNVRDEFAVNKAEHISQNLSLRLPNETGFTTIYHNQLCEDSYKLRAYYFTYLLVSKSLDNDDVDESIDVFDLLYKSLDVSLSKIICQGEINFYKFIVEYK